ncbi:MAG: S8 family serine peptidase [Flavobacteriaceae bacterium]|nr:S8 family serine peptidase [Flavobacteriaceae bacterium]
MNYSKTNLIAIACLTITLSGCGGAAPIISTPVENIDTTPLKEVELTEAELQNWAHLDLVSDTVPGMSVNKAYKEIIKNKKGNKTIVAVIDSGIDIDHEDLSSVIWTNSKEVPNNGKDDDNNGYIDDVHGWNFLGTAYDEQLEYVRLLASGNTNHPRYNEAKAERDKDYQKALSSKNRIEQIAQQVNTADKAVANYLKKDVYTREEVNAIKTENQELKQHISIIKQMYAFGFDSITEVKKEINDDIVYYTERLNYHFNTEFKGRTTGDDPDDFSQVTYGDNNVKYVKPEEDHGTHVAGIIAAKRNNGKGINGIANNVQIMPIRVVPNGDEYDKDVYLAIKYAVDNGAKIINTSFGKYYSPHSDKVREAIAYAGQNDVLIINAAGNEGIDLDKKDVYPNDAVGTGKEVSDTFISVGALYPKYGSELIASYSNYGKINVDIFAPGSKIYSTVPENDYSNMNGTSMAAPAVSGIAAIIRSQYPNLSATQVKQVILDSGLPLNSKVMVSGNYSNIKSFDTLSSSGKIANAYNALILASKISKK